MKFCLVLTTCASAKQAQEIARTLIESKLAACVQLSSQITSIYRWDGKVQSEPEVQVWIKTKAFLFDEISQCIRNLHSYEVPEIIQIPIEQGTKEYLNWLDNETNSH